MKILRTAPELERLILNEMSKAAICDAVSAVADHAETRSVTCVEVEQATGVDLYMMFDPGHSLDERILREQFGY